MTNKIKKFLYILVHLIPDGHVEIPTFALYHPMLPELKYLCRYYADICFQKINVKLIGFYNGSAP